MLARPAGGGRFGSWISKSKFEVGLEAWWKCGPCSMQNLVRRLVGVRKVPASATAAGCVSVLTVHAAVAFSSMSPGPCQQTLTKSAGQHVYLQHGAGMIGLSRTLRARGEIRPYCAELRWVNFRTPYS